MLAELTPELLALTALAGVAAGLLAGAGAGAGGSMLGSWIGSHLAIRKGQRFVRIVFLAVVILLIAKLAWDLI